MSKKILSGNILAAYGDMIEYCTTDSVIVEEGTDETKNYYHHTFASWG